MSKARNDPCPCGSGRKFKRCCGSQDGDPARAVYTDGQIVSALQKLVAFSMEDEFQEGKDAVRDFFLGDEDLDEDMLEELMDRTSVLENMTLFLVLETAEEGEETILETFLRRRGRSLEAGERRFLLDLRETHVSLYEVQALLPERGIRVLDLLRGGEVEIADPELGRNAAPWDVFGARLLQRPQGHWVIQGEVYELQRGHKESLLESIQKIEAAVRSESPANPARVVSRSIGLLLHRASMSHLLDEVLEPASEEGAEPFIAVTVFEVRDQPALEERLRACDEFEQTLDGWAWLSPAGSDAPPQGMIWIDGDRLELETVSREEARRGRALLESLAGPAISFRLEELCDDLEDEDFDGGELEHGELECGHGGAGDDFEDSEEARRERLATKEKHYRDWLDRGIPALDGSTPRQVSRSPGERHRLVELLKTVENWEVRKARQGEVLLDTAWMWRELGIERPGG